MIKVLFILLFLCLATMSYGKKEEDAEHIPATAPPGNSMLTPYVLPTKPNTQIPNTPIPAPIEQPTSEPIPNHQPIIIQRMGMTPSGLARYVLSIPNTFGIAQMRLVVGFPEGVTATEVKLAPENKCLLFPETPEGSLTIKLECVPTLVQGIRLVEWGLPTNVIPPDVKVINCSVNAVADSCFLTGQ